MEHLSRTWSFEEPERALSLRMFSRDILSDDGGFTVKHHQQTFVWQKQQETIVLSYVGVFISYKPVCGMRSLIVNLLSRPREEPPALQQGSVEPMPSLLYP